MTSCLVCVSFMATGLSLYPLARSLSSKSAVQSTASRALT